MESIYRMTHRAKSIEAQELTNYLFQLSQMSHRKGNKNASKQIMDAALMLADLTNVSDNLMDDIERANDIILERKIENDKLKAELVELRKKVDELMNEAMERV
jgi:Na+/phosphate symporter